MSGKETRSVAIGMVKYSRREYVNNVFSHSGPIVSGVVATAAPVSSASLHRKAGGASNESGHTYTPPSPEAEHASGCVGWKRIEFADPLCS